MKEVLTKKFWQDVKKTFYEAMEESPAPDEKPAPKAAEPEATSTQQDKDEQK